MLGFITSSTAYYIKQVFLFIPCINETNGTMRADNERDSSLTRRYSSPRRIASPVRRCRRVRIAAFLGDTLLAKVLQLFVKCYFLKSPGVGRLWGSPHKIRGALRSQLIYMKVYQTTRIEYSQNSNWKRILHIGNIHLLTGLVGIIKLVLIKCSAWIISINRPPVNLHKDFKVNGRFDT